MKLLLEAGIVEVADVVEWADSVLLSSPEYDDDLANVCLGRRKTREEMFSLLGRLIDHHEEWDAMRRTMARMYDVLRENPNRGHDFARVLERFWVRHNYDVPDDMRFMSGIEDTFQLAKEGLLGTVEEATKSLTDNLSRFKERPI